MRRADGHGGRNRIKRTTEPGDWPDRGRAQAQFRFLGSTTRRDDIVGTMLERWNTEELQELDPLETALEAADGSTGDPVPVRLHSRITEVGTLELSCQSTRDPRRWKLEFNVREANEE